MTAIQVKRNIHNNGTEANIGADKIRQAQQQAGRNTSQCHPVQFATQTEVIFFRRDVLTLRYFVGFSRHNSAARDQQTQINSLCSSPFFDEPSR